jgi:hypothetical protein
MMKERGGKRSFEVCEGEESRYELNSELISMKVAEARVCIPPGFTSSDVRGT